MTKVTDNITSNGAAAKLQGGTVPPEATQWKIRPYSVENLTLPNAHHEKGGVVKKRTKKGKGKEWKEEKIEGKREK